MKKLGKFLWDYWMKFAHIVGEVNQFILLGIIYFFLIGLYALIAFPIGYIQKPKTSGWKISPLPQSKKQLTRPF